MGREILGRWDGEQERKDCEKVGKVWENENEKAEKNKSDVKGGN